MIRPRSTECLFPLVPPRRKKEVQLPAARPLVSELLRSRSDRSGRPDVLCLGQSVTVEIFDGPRMCSRGDVGGDILACDSRTTFAVPMTGSSSSSAGVGSSVRRTSPSCVGSTNGSSGGKCSFEGPCNHESGDVLASSLFRTKGIVSSTRGGIGLSMPTPASSGPSTPRSKLLFDVLPLLSKPASASSFFCLSALRCNLRCNFSKSVCRFFSLRFRSRSISSLKPVASKSSAKSSMRLRSLMTASGIVGRFSLRVEVREGPRLLDPVA